MVLLARSLGPQGLKPAFLADLNGTALQLAEKVVGESRFERGMHRES